MDNGGVSAGEVGGVTAGVLMVIQAGHRLLRWIAGWQDRRLKSEDARLQGEAARLADWQSSLDRREREQRILMETEIGELRDEVEAQGRKLADQTALTMMTRMALGDVVAELERHAPDSPALQRAKALMHAPSADVMVPADLASLARAVDERTS